MQNYKNAILNSKKIKNSLEDVSNKYIEKNKSLEELENIKKDITKKIDQLNQESNIINQDSLIKLIL